MDRHEMLMKNLHAKIEVEKIDERLRKLRKDEKGLYPFSDLVELRASAGHIVSLATAVEAEAQAELDRRREHWRPAAESESRYNTIFDDQMCTACENEGHDEPVEVRAHIDWEYPRDWYVIGTGRCERGHTVSEFAIREMMIEQENIELERSKP